MAEQALFPLTFEDVAIYFSEQEWRDLEGWQKELYKHVMRANYETLVSLDDGLPKPELISWIEQESEPFRNWEESHKSGSIICSSADLHFEPLTDQELFGRSQQAVDSGEAKFPHLWLDPLQSQHSFGPFLGEREAAPCRPSHGVTLRNPQKHDTWALTLTRHSSSESTQTERIPGLRALSPPGLQEVPFWESAQHPCPLCGPNFWKKNHSVTQQRSYSKNPPHRARKKLSKRAGAQPQWNPLRVQRHFWCHECGRSFCPRQHLLKHLAAHPGWGPCCGPACQMCCYQPVHSREKPSQGLRCLLVNSTQVHQSQHGGERPSPRREGHQALSDLHSGQTLGLGLGCEECCPQEGGTETLKSSHGRERPCSGLESGKCFPTRAQLTRQHTVRTGATPFKCPECNRCFYLRGRLQVSLCMHSRERPCCRKCGKDFSRWCQLTEHVRVHSSEKPFWCATCGRDFRQRGQLLRHQRLHSDEKPFQCPECGLSFRLQSMLRAHRLRHGGQRPFSCSECGRGFTHPCKLREHLRVHSGERPFQCPECDKRFRLKGVLKAHQRTHSTERPFSCRECGKGFTRQSKLTEHFRLHSGERPFQCAECDRSFRLRGQLLSHQRLHTGERPFQCPECDKSYRVKADMKAHLLQHRGEMPFSCECGKGFAKQSKLTEHIRTHTGEKPFQCPQCDKSFRLKAQLLSHQGLHTGERPFHCPECNKSFRERGHVLRHQRIHRPERPFSCGDCGKGFIYKSKLAEHVRVHTKARRAPEEPDMKKRLSQLIAMIEADWS